MGTHPIFESDFDCLTVFRNGPESKWPFVALTSSSTSFVSRTPTSMVSVTYLRHDRHQGYWSTILQHHLQEGRYRHHQASRSTDDEEIKRMETIMLNPRQYKVPDYFLNRQNDAKDGTFTQVISNGLETKLREDLERMKKIRCHRGLRHYWMLRVRGQHTKTTGRRGRTVGVSKKK